LHFLAADVAAVAVDVAVAVAVAVAAVAAAAFRIAGRSSPHAIVWSLECAASGTKCSIFLLQNDSLFYFNIQKKKYLI